MSNPKPRSGGGEVKTKNPAVTPEPPPMDSDGELVWEFVIRIMLQSSIPDDVKATLSLDMRSRDDFGESKYGKRLRTGDGRDAVADAYQEDLDRAAYYSKAALETGEEFWGVRAGYAIVDASVTKQWLMKRDRSSE